MTEELGKAMLMAARKRERNFGLPGFSWPLESTGCCGQCLRTFDLSEGACPKCGATSGIATVRIGSIPEIPLEKYREALVNCIGERIVKDLEHEWKEERRTNDERRGDPSQGDRHLDLDATRSPDEGG